ncbi:monooxygenase [Abortiporus biennis]|nr:monooxygenase [Abortiporus biennis]
MPQESPQVLIVGSGPAGLVLALTLAQNGIPLRIIEKRIEFHQSQRGSGVQPRSLELYKFLDVYEDMKQGSIPIPPICQYKLPGGREPDTVYRMIPTSDATPDIPYPDTITIGQYHAEAILRDHLRKFGIEVELNSELLSFQQDNTRVSAEILKRSSSGSEETRELATFDFLVGADGAKGITRKQIGLPFSGSSASPATRRIVGDVYVEGLTMDYWHSWRPGNAESLLLMPTEVEGLFFLILFTSNPAEYDRIMASKESLQQFICRTTTRDDIIVESIRTLSDFNPSIRMTNKFGEGRSFIVGDAAHVHSPMGAQGMNSSIQDSFNLGWKLSLVCKNLSPMSLLDTYTEERLPIIKAMLAKTTESQNQMTKKLHNPKAAWSVPKSLNQLRVNCRWSSILVEGQHKVKTALETGDADTNARAYGSDDDDELRAGDRAPEAPGLRLMLVNPISGIETTSLFSIFKPTCHTILLFEPLHHQLPMILESLSSWAAGTVLVVLILSSGSDVDIPKEVVESLVVCEDKDGYAYEAYKKAIGGGSSVVIVRPDGVVGGIVKGVEGIKTYHDKLFIV